MPRLFGTDGARGVANRELTCELAMKIGRAAAVVLAGAGKSRPKILIGMDPRISSQMLEAALTGRNLLCRRRRAQNRNRPHPRGCVSRQKIRGRRRRYDFGFPQFLRI